MFDPGWTLADYAGDVRAVLDHLGVARFAMVAISGGGPYAAHVAAAMPDRIVSLHFAAALADVTAGGAERCAAPPEALTQALTATVDNPQRWWAFPANSPTRAISGFADRAYDEGARAFFIRGQMGDARPEVAEMQRYCTAHLADLPLKRVMAPVFTYYGTADPLVPPANAGRWRSWLGGPVMARSYPGAAHDVQYRHWDQVLIDLSGLAGTGPKARTLVCSGGKARLVVMPSAKSTIGLCLWQKHP
jgi:pimeloyl-ACP methyl ester carboxylesterase